MTGSRTEDVLLPKRRVYAAETWEARRRDAWTSFTGWLREEIWELTGPASIVVETPIGPRTIAVEIDWQSSGPSRVAVPARVLDEKEYERMEASSSWAKKPVRRSGSSPAELYEFRMKSASRSFGARDLAETFERVFGIPHPNGIAVKIVEHTTGRIRTSRFEQRTVTVERETRNFSLMTESELNTAVVVHDRDELGRLVFRSLRRMFDSSVKAVSSYSWDVPLGAQNVRVIIGPIHPRVLLIAPNMPRPFGFAEFPHRRIETMVETSYLRFVDAGTRFSVMVDIPAHPFVPRHLDDAIGQLRDFIELCRKESTAGKEARTRYRAIYQDDHPTAAAAGEERPEDESLPPPLLTLIHLDEDGSRGLSPLQVAHVCNHDRDAILEYLRMVKEQELEWLSAADGATATGDTEEAASCNHEAAAWGKTYQQLRAALEVTVLPGNRAPCEDCSAAVENT